jgi:glucosamine kinase
MAALSLVALGMDIGGTATRVLILDSEGRRRGAGRAGGGNPTAHPRGVWTHAMSEALSRAIAESGPVKVGSVVVGVAGAGTSTDRDAVMSFERIIRSETGCRCRIEVTDDAVIAFAAGTAHPDGTVLVAGTGTIAAAIRDRSAVNLVDGHGWLLGDQGSGFWIGREAVQAVLADLDGRGPMTSLRPLVVQTVLGRDPVARDARTTCAAIVRAVHARAPICLSELAPLASRCASDGDQVALGIARGATDRLVSAVKAVRSADEITPIVVTGGVAAGDHVIAGLLRQQLEALWPTCVRSVPDGVAGASWLALKGLPGIGRRKAAELHPFPDPDLPPPEE